ncbi:MAG: ABC transporter substrate-binding protein [Acidimicrobiia bacterium]
MRKIRKGSIGAMLLVVALIAAACSSGDDSGSREGTTIVIGSANFGESALVAEIYAQALEADGFTVERKLNTGSREIYAAALESGELHLVPEYVGSALSYKGGTPTSDTDQTTSDLRDAWSDDGISVLEPAPAQDKNGIVVTSDTATQLGLTTTSDLAAHNGTLNFGGPPECPEREFCLIGLESVYGLSFAEFKPLDVGGPLTVAALEGGEIDVALLFTTDGVIVSKGFVLLEDDQGLQPAENLIPALRTDIAEEYGGNIERVLNAVSAVLTTGDLTELNKLTGYDGEDPAEVASNWLESVGITG